MVDWIRKAKKTILWASVIGLIPGVAMIAFPSVMSGVLIYLLGAVVVFVGAALLLLYAYNVRRGTGDSFGLIKGIVTLALGLLILLRSELFVNVVFVIIALAVLACSFYHIQLSVAAKRGGFRFWWLILCGGFVGVVLSVLIMLDPSVMLNALIVLAGVGIVWDSLFNIYALYACDKFI